jgi:hypothetical protein
MNDTGQDSLALHYVRDKEKREVDFVIVRKNKPLILIACKCGDETPHSSLTYFAEKLKVGRAIQLISHEITPRRFTGKGNFSADIVSASSFLKHLI